MELAISQKRIKTANDCLNRHHIVPRSLGGDNSIENIVLLTAREHYIAHKLLVRIHVGENRKKMIYALWWMSKTISKNTHSNITRITSRDYETARKMFIEANVNDDPVRKERFRKNHKAGKYKYDYEKVARTMKDTLANLSSSEMQTRMLNSALTADPIARANAIKRGKASTLKIINIDGTSEIIFSDQVSAILNVSWPQVKYRVSAHNGFLLDGRQVIILKKYTGGNKWKNK